MAGVCKSYKSKRSWRIWWLINKKQFFAKISKIEFSSIKDALFEAMRREKEEYKVVSSHITFEEFVTHQYYKENIINQGSIPAYKQMMSRFLPFIDSQGVKYINDIREDIINRYKVYSFENLKLSPKTINRDLDYINKICDLICFKKHIPSWNRKFIKRFKEVRKEYDQSILPTFEESRRIAKWIYNNEPYYLLWIHFIVKWGSRRDEIRKIKLDDINFDKRELKLYISKTNSIIIQPLSEQDLLVINEHILILKKLGIASSDGYIFPNIAKKRKPHLPNIITKNNLYNWLKKVALRLGINKKVNPHSFRHSLVSGFKTMGVKDKDIMAITGHKSVKSLQHYDHPNAEEAKKLLLNRELNILPDYKKV